MKANPARAAAVLLAASALLGCNNLTGSVEASADEKGSDVNGDDPSGITGQSPPNKSMKCAYPVGNFGVNEMQIVPVTHAWEGYAPGATEPGTLHIADLYDCDGSLGINAILFDTSQFG